MGLFSRVPNGAKAVKPRLYQAIDRATSEYLSAPNLAQNMDVVSTVNSAVDPVYAATKACKRIALRLRTRNQRVQFVALQLLENCMRSCGEPFHNELAKSELFNNELTRMADRSIWCATEIQRLILALIQEWAYEIQNPAFSTLFNKLKHRGLPFGPRGLPNDQVYQSYPGLPPSFNGKTDGAGNASQPSSPSHQHHRRHRHGRHTGADQQEGEGRAPSRGTNNLGPDLLRPGRSTADLKSDLEVARGTVALLNEVLDGIEKEANWGAVKEEYCAEVAGACAALTDRIAALLGSAVSDEGVVSAAIEINEDAQRAVDRRMTLMEVADGKRAPPVTVTAERIDPAETAAVGAAASSPSAAAPPAAAPAAAPAPILDLLDLDWNPAPESDSIPADPFLPPPPMVPPPMNNPFAAVEPNAAANGDAHPTVTAEKLSSAAAAASTASGTLDASAGTTPVSTTAAEGTESNPFLNDDAFSQLSLSREPSTLAAAAPTVPASTVPEPPKQPIAAEPSPAAAAPPRPSGNPFASASFDTATSAPPLHSSGGSGSFNRPPALVIPGGTSDPLGNTYVPTPGPYTAPAAYPGAPPTSTPAGYQAYTFNAGPPTANAAAGMHHQQLYHSHPGFAPPPTQPSGGYLGGVTPSYGAPTPTPAFETNPYLSMPTYPTPTGDYAQQQSMYGSAPLSLGGHPPQRPISDSFKDLVVLKPKREEPPPPPKGSPMRRGGSTTSNASQTGMATTPIASGANGAAAAAPVSPPPARDAGLSAFDAFDALASGR